MAIQLKSPTLPKTSLYLAVTSVVLVPFGFIVAIIGNIASLAWRPAVLIGLIAGIAWISSPGFAIAAIVTGHLARRRYPGEVFGRAGLIVGYAALGFVILVGLLSVATWLTISTKSTH